MPDKEASCRIIHTIVLEGGESEHFQWALTAANQKEDPACSLGTVGSKVSADKIISDTFGARQIILSP